MPDKVIPPLPTEDGTYTNRFITESNSERGGIESAHIYQLNHGFWRVCLWNTETAPILRGASARDEVERANRSLGGLVKLTPEVVDEEDRPCMLCNPVHLATGPCTHIKGIGTGTVSMSETAWRRWSDELTRLRTAEATWLEAQVAGTAVPEPPVEYEYGAKFFIDVGGGPASASLPSGNPDRLKRRYTIPVGSYPTIAALKEDYDIPNEAIILRRRKKARPEDANYPWETA